jgi:putative ABC transport system permease protein
MNKYLRKFNLRLNDTFITAHRALWANKVRTALTMLGVVIGVFSVVSLVSLVQGVQNYVTDQFNELGSNLVFVSPGRAAINEDPAVAFTNNKLDESHLDLIEKHASDYVYDTSPMITVQRSITYKTKKYFGIVTGVNHNYLDIDEVKLTEGRNFTVAEEEGNARVAILGPKAKEDLFGVRKAVGEKIKIDNRSYLIIGVTEERGPDWDELILFPYTTVQRVMDVDVFSYIYVKLKDGVNVDIGTKEIELALLRDLKKDDFTLLNAQDLLESVQEILNILSIGLTAVAAISLLVGGIGIMNIMLVSVTERTKEVGLRKALGATPFNIGLQFLIESSMISLGGGFIGLGFGYLTTFIARQFLRAEVPWWAVLLSLSFSIVVGLIFGTYPALVAAKKDPIEALRYE